MLDLQVIIASTRPERAGKPIADWFLQVASEHNGFRLHVSDLAELALPLMDEHQHPVLKQYQHAHTRDWSATVAAADAFVLVMPEYNHGYTAPLKNALDYLAAEWAYKPVGFVSYGGIAGGTRAVQSLKPVLTCLKMFPITTQVALPFFSQHLESGAFTPGEAAAKAGYIMLDELARLGQVLGALRR